MIKFNCDYLEGACPEIMDRMLNTNFEQTFGYSEDEHCDTARSYIKAACDAPDADVHFLVGGTQTNTTVISAMLRPYQGVLSAETGHINVHETGAIEATGHKVLALPCRDTTGKIYPDQIEDYYVAHVNDDSFEHMVQPAMVYISNPTENGGLYSKAELEAISALCKKYSLPLFLDGARLGYGLCAPGNDLYLEDYARLCDVFYIGGTKCGALFGEAVVITNDAIKKDFRYMIKRHGGMLAKGRLLGIQFETLFEDGLYERVCSHAARLAIKIKNALLHKGYELLTDSVTNQQFPIFPNEKLEELKKDFSFSFWCKVGEDKSAVRICTSWATSEENVDLLISKL